MMRILLTIFLACGLLGVEQSQSLHAQAKTGGRVRTSTTECGPVSDGLLKCPRFGFTYKIPYGWVDRSDDMQEEGEGGEQESAPAEKSQTLLAIFERPPGAPGETINSAVVIAAESLADYHGVKTAADYFGPITELAEERGFKAVNDPYAVSIGAKQLVREDFSKERGKLTMWQSSLVMIDKGYIVSFTFVGGSEDDIEELIGNLNFGARLSRPPPAPAK